MSQNSEPATTPRRTPRHLIDFDNPRPQPTRRDAESLSKVQKWVMSVLTVTTIMHLSAGVILAAAFLEHPRPGARIGLLVIGGLFGVGAIAAGRGIHQKRLLSPWLLLGWIPAVIGAFFVL
ncbi:MAG: hypothetical protein JWR35_103 [Marmoricola sp.]|nr:hypothetical protein [Marmoricola sp.]